MVVVNYKLNVNIKRIIFDVQHNTLQMPLYNNVYGKYYIIISINLLYTYINLYEIQSVKLCNLSVTKYAKYYNSIFQLINL